MGQGDAGSNTTTIRDRGERGAYRRWRFPGAHLSPAIQTETALATRTLPGSPAVPREWLDWVNCADDEGLVRLLKTRPDLAVPPPADLVELAERMLSAGSVAACYERLDRSSRQLLAACCLIDGPADEAALARLLGVEPPDCEALLDHVAALGLLRRDGERLHPVPSLSAVIGSPAGLGPPAGRLLASQQISTLTAMAARLDAPLPARATRAAVVSAVVAVLSDRSQLARLLERAPKGTSELAEAIAHRGQAHMPQGTYMATQGAGAKTPAGWLMGRGMIVPTSWSTAAMPREVALALRGGLPFPDFTPGPPPLERRPLSPGGADASAAEAARTLVDQVAAICEEWAVSGARQLQAGGLGVREVRRAAKLIGREETATARIIEVAVAAGLVVSADDEWVLPTALYDDWIATPIAERWATLASRWWAAPIHLSLAGARDERDKPIPPVARPYPEPAAMGRRHLVLDALASLPEDETASEASVVQAVLWSAPALWEEGPARPATLVGWVLAEAEMLGVTGGGALRSWGRRLANGDVEGAAAELARHLPATTDRAVFQGDLTAVVTGEPSADLGAGLRLLADVESSGAASVHRFSEASLRRAFDAGWTAPQVRQWLGAHATKDVPQALGYLVDDLGRRHGALRAGRACSYLRCEDPTLLAEIVSARRAASLGLRLLAPTVAVSSRDTAQVVEVLRAAGYLPSAEDANGALVVTRPKGRRAPALAGDDEVLDDLFDHPELLAEVMGVGGEAAAAMAGQVRRFLAGDEDALDPPDPAGLVKRLRQRPVAPSKVRSPAPARPAQPPQAPPQLRLLADDGTRSTEICKDRHGVAWLLQEAERHEWTLRLSYTNAKGVRRELNVDVLQVADACAYCQVAPAGSSQTIRIDRIHWARALTEAEEEAMW